MNADYDSAPDEPKRCEHGETGPHDMGYEPGKPAHHGYRPTRCPGPAPDDEVPQTFDEADVERVAQAIQNAAGDSVWDGDEFFRGVAAAAIQAMRAARPTREQIANALSWEHDKWSHDDDGTESWGLALADAVLALETHFAQCRDAASWRKPR